MSFVNITENIMYKTRLMTDLNDKCINPDLSDNFLDERKKGDIFLCIFVKINCIPFGTVRQIPAYGQVCVNKPRSPSYNIRHEILSTIICK